MPESTCSGCGLTFTGITAFDRHQRRSGMRVECRNPLKLDPPLQPVIRKRGRVMRVVFSGPTPARRPMSWRQ